ncbi:hypothetical protein HMPREF0307_02248 [Corynebacterium sp. DNF00584]|nr:hypothetical protein HMPREF0307_02248 [Corynebacterium sp. DNF00584]
MADGEVVSAEKVCGAADVSVVAVISVVTGSELGASEVSAVEEHEASARVEAVRRGSALKDFMRSSVPVIEDAVMSHPSVRGIPCGE